MRFILTSLLASMMLTVSPTAPLAAQGAASATAATFRQWGMEDIRHIDAAFRLPGGSLYVDEITPGQVVPTGRPAFMWGCGIQLSALNAAARVDRAVYLPALRRCIAALDAYWAEKKGIGGYGVLPKPSPADRYYDDNEWIVLGLVDAYDLTQDPRILARAREVFHFVMSGQDDVLGGGIY